MIQPRRLVAAVATGDGLPVRCLGDDGHCAELARGAAALGSLQALEDILLTRVTRVLAELGDSRYIALSRLGEHVLAVYVEGVSLGAAHLVLRVLEEELGQ